MRPKHFDDVFSLRAEIYHCLALQLSQRRVSTNVRKYDSAKWLRIECGLVHSRAVHFIIEPYRS